MVVNIAELSFRPRRRNYRVFTVDINRHPTIYTVVTSNPNHIRRWINHILNNHCDSYNSARLTLGMAIEANRHNRRPAATLTLSCAAHCLLVQLCHTPYAPTELLQFLNDPRISFVSLYDFAGIEGLFPLGLHTLLAMPMNLRSAVVGVHRDDSIARFGRAVGVAVRDRDMASGDSDWEVLNLSRGQVLYATIDAFVPFCIGIRHHAWRFNPYLVLLRSIEFYPSLFRLDESE